MQLRWCYYIIRWLFNKLNYYELCMLLVDNRKEERRVRREMRERGL